MAIIKVRKYKDSVYVIYSHDNKKFKVFTGVKIDDKYWDTDKLRRNCPKYESAKAQIDSVYNQVLNSLLSTRQKGLNPTPELVRKEYQEKALAVLRDQENESIWIKYRNFLDRLTCRENTKRRINMSYTIMEYFCKKSGYNFEVSTFNRMTLSQLIYYLVEDQKLADSTIAKHLKSVKMFLKTAYPEKDWSWIRYGQLNTEIEVVTLTESELNTLKKAVLKGYLEKTRDLFMFMVTTGMRYSDSQLFDPSWQTPEQVLEFVQLKTGVKAYPPLYCVAQGILRKYQGCPPKISNQKFNYFLKTLFKYLDLNRPVVTQLVRGKQVFRTVKPLNEVISSHTARRTFITICLQKGMPIQMVMKMSGHSDFNSMRPYIKVARKELREVANRWEI